MVAKSGGRAVVKEGAERGPKSDRTVLRMQVELRGQRVVKIVVKSGGGIAWRRASSSAAGASSLYWSNNVIK